MLAPQSIPNFPPRVTASLALLGLVTVASLGIAGCVVLTLALLWLVVHLALLTLQAFIETLSIIGATYAAADHLVQFLFLAAIGYVMYHVYQKIVRKGASYEREH